MSNKSIDLNTYIKKLCLHTYICLYIMYGLGLNKQLKVTPEATKGHTQTVCLPGRLER